MILEYYFLSHNFYLFSSRKSSKDILSFFFSVLSVGLKVGSVIPAKINKKSTASILKFTCKNATYKANEKLVNQKKKAK